MGVPGFLLASTLNLSVAQRLLRTLCPHCKAESDLLVEDLPERYQNVGITKQYKASGCNQCYFTGFTGRKAIYEVINITKELGEQIKHNATDIDAYCKLNKINKLADNALQLFKLGETTLEEIYPYLIHEN
jgi:type II secretory ATPase GspE/PulE/Tfp pilus assembly ATPase PilB-like protein